MAPLGGRAFCPAAHVDRGEHSSGSPWGLAQSGGRPHGQLPVTAAWGRGRGGRGQGRAARP
eukprot:13432670-Alexandrium_andersonii.AAC.1